MIELIERQPIKLNKNTVALLQIFTNFDDLEDIGLLSECYTVIDYKAEAQQLVSQFKGHLCAAGATAFSGAFKQFVDEWTAEYPGRPSYDEMVGVFTKESEK